MFCARAEQVANTVAAARRLAESSLLCIVDSFHRRKLRRLFSLPFVPPAGRARQIRLDYDASQRAVAKGESYLEGLLLRSFPDSTMTSAVAAIAVARNQSIAEKGVTPSAPASGAR